MSFREEIRTILDTIELDKRYFYRVPDEEEQYGYLPLIDSFPLVRGFELFGFYFVKDNRKIIHNDGEKYCIESSSFALHPVLAQKLHYEYGDIVKLTFLSFDDLMKVSCDVNATACMFYGGEEKLKHEITRAGHECLVKLLYAMTSYYINGVSLEDITENFITENMPDDFAKTILK